MRRWWPGIRRRWRGSVAAVRRHPRKVALIAAPWLLALLVGLPVLWFEVDRAVREPERQGGREAVEYAAQSLLRWVAQLHQDAQFLAELTPRLLDAGQQAMLAETYTSFLLAGADYHKVRWVDAAGRERLRVDQDRGVVYLVPEPGLQDKGERPFVRLGLALQPGQVYLSPLDLNVERGRVEQPLRPTLRAASPFHLADGRSGLAVINYQGGQLLDRLQEQARHAGYVLYLVHSEGWWIIGPGPGDAWGWQLGRPERTVARFDPGLWQAMRGQPAGQWGEWTFATLESVWGKEAARLLAHADPALGPLQVLVRRQTASGARWKAILVLLTLAVTALAATVVLAQARALAREAAYVDRLRKANHALHAANTRLHAAREGLARADRLSSLGLMVAGVAHEMNTPLGTAQLALSTLRTRVEELAGRLRGGLRRSDLEGFLAAAGEATGLAEAELRRAAVLVQRFKQVAVDRGSVERRRFDLAEAILDADPRLRRGELVPGIPVVLELEAGVAMDSYPGPLEQVVFNLLANALAHGYPEGGPGRIRVSAGAEGPALVRIEVADEGQGIAAEDLPRIFEPFFTTGRHRGGTGLGLHIVHQVVSEVLGGEIRVRSRRPGDPGGGPAGTVFTLRIPRIAPDRAGP